MMALTSTPVSTATRAMPPYPATALLEQLATWLFPHPQPPETMLVVAPRLTSVRCCRSSVCWRS